MNDKVKELLATQSYKGVPVITTVQLTEILAAGSSTVRSTLCVHKNEFKEGVHYYKLSRQELLAVKQEGVIPVNPAAINLTLLTEKGVKTYLHLKTTSHQGKALPNKQQKTQQSLVTTKTIWSQEPVLTTEQLANFYKTTADNIKVNFNRNQDRFVEGKHYFKLEGQNLVTFKNCVTNSYLVQNNTSTLYLWTKRGAARHAKMLHTDKAWEVFEQLEDTYFAVQEGTVTQKVQPTMNREEFKQTIAKINQAEEQRVTAIQKVATLRKQLTIAENDLSSLETAIETLYKTVNVVNTPSDINKVIEAAQTIQPLLQDGSYTIGDLHKLVENKMSVSELHDYAKTKGELSDTFNRNRAKLSEEDAAIIMATLGVKLENVSQALLQQTMSFHDVTEKLAALGYTQLQGQNLSASNLLSLLKEQNLPLEEQPHKKGFLIKNNAITKQTFLDLLSFLGKPS